VTFPHEPISGIPVDKGPRHDEIPCSSVASGAITCFTGSLD